MKNTWKGVMHAHSINSYDGKLTYAELRDYFSNNNINFVCMTEHIEQLNQSDIDRIIKECKENSTNDFLFIPGIEMDCFVIYFVGIKNTAINFKSNKTLYNSFIDNSELCILAHPIKAKYNYPKWITDRCDGVEVINTKHDGQHYLRPQSEDLFRQLLLDNNKLIATAGMDFHDRKHFNSIHIRLSNEGPLNENHIIESLRNNDFEIYKGDIPLSSYSFLKINFARLHIFVMDYSHKLHRWLRKQGIPIPNKLKSLIRKIMEGS